MEGSSLLRKKGVRPEFVPHSVKETAESVLDALAKMGRMDLDGRRDVMWEVVRDPSSKPEELNTVIKKSMRNVSISYAELHHRLMGYAREAISAGHMFWGSLPESKDHEESVLAAVRSLRVNTELLVAALGHRNVDQDYAAPIRQRLTNIYQNEKDYNWVEGLTGRMNGRAGISQEFRNRLNEEWSSFMSCIREKIARDSPEDMVRSDNSKRVSSDMVFDYSYMQGPLSPNPPRVERETRVQRDEKTEKEKAERDYRRELELQNPGSPHEYFNVQLRERDGTITGYATVGLNISLAEKALRERLRRLSEDKA